MKRSKVRGLRIKIESTVHHGLPEFSHIWMNFEQIKNWEKYLDEFFDQSKDKIKQQIKNELS